VAQRQSKRHRATEGVTEHDWAPQTEDTAEGNRIIGHLFDRTGLEWWPAGSPLAPQVEIDELGEGGEWRQERLEISVVETGSSMQGEDDWALSHSFAVGNEGSPLGVEPQVGAVDGEAHGRPFRGTGEHRLVLYANRLRRQSMPSRSSLAW
jgi:hypothetical protein